MAIALSPAAFANFCILNEIQPTEAIAIVPTWIYSVRGDKIGTRTRPYRLSDYVTALYFAKSPRAIRSRIQSSSLLSSLPNRKRKASEDERSPTKKPKIDIMDSANRPVKEEKSENLLETNEDVAEGPEIALKSE